MVFKQHGGSAMVVKEDLLLQKAYYEIEKNKDKVFNDPYRLGYHLMPPVGLLNDPNGLIQYKGIYHVFYQWNPFNTAHGNKFWGHYSSKDMVHWKEEPIALAPVDWYDKNGCYSGSAVESDGRLYLFYTGNVKRKDGSRETYQCLAVSSDGVTFEKHGPILQLPKGYTAHFRDPKVWKKDEMWYMILGAQTIDKQGVIALFTSKDLYHWENAGRIAGAGMNGLGEFGYMWECPDFFHLNGGDILLSSPQGLDKDGNLYQNVFQSGYFIGEFDYENLKYRHGHFTELDQGFDFYAPQTFIDGKGRRILYGWMGITDDTEQYHPTIYNNWVHALTMPRELIFKNGRVYQHPIEEMKTLRKEKVVIKHIKIEGNKVQYDCVEGKSIELIVDLLTVGTREFNISFRHEAILSYDTSKKEISLKRRNLKTGYLEKRVCKISNLSRLHIFMDCSSLEVFINDGEQVMTSRYFPNPKDQTITINGDAEFNLSKWELEK